MNIIVRKSNKEDMPQVLGLIKELALYEKAPEAVTNTVEDMISDGFSSNPVFFCDVAEADNRIIGIAVYFIKYSTWKGKGVYLDDIVVTESWRGKGVGKKLFDHVMKESVKHNAKQLHWQVLGWNEPAINFYKKYPTEFDSEWINCKLSDRQLRDILL
jgi:GNAT superfamily N-acetyltransferase